MNFCINFDIIEDFIKKNNMSRINFCKLCKISVKTLIKLKKKNVNCYSTTIVKIADIIGVKVSQMIIRKYVV